MSLLQERRAIVRRNALARDQTRDFGKVVRVTNTSSDRHTYSDNVLNIRVSRGVLNFYELVFFRAIFN